jgi:hypothetical protein
MLLLLGCLVENISTPNRSTKVVNYSGKSCQCGAWQNTGIICIHGLCVAYQNDFIANDEEAFARHAFDRMYLSQTWIENCTYDSLIRLPSCDDLQLDEDIKPRFKVEKSKKTKRHKSSSEAFSTSKKRRGLKENLQGNSDSGDDKSSESDNDDSTSDSDDNNSDSDDRKPQTLWSLFTSFFSAWPMSPSASSSARKVPLSGSSGSSSASSSARKVPDIPLSGSSGSSSASSSARKVPLSESSGSSSASSSARKVPLSESSTLFYHDLSACSDRQPSGSSGAPDIYKIDEELYAPTTTAPTRAAPTRAPKRCISSNRPSSHPIDTYFPIRAPFVPTGTAPTGTAPTGTAPTGTAPTGTAPTGTDWEGYSFVDPTTGNVVYSKCVESAPVVVVAADLAAPEDITYRWQRLSSTGQQFIVNLWKTPKNRCLVDKFNILMDIDNMNCLRPCKWLNDEVINFYMAMLQEYHDRHGTTGSFKFINSFFMFKLLHVNDRPQFCYKNVQRWIKKDVLRTLDRLFVPININNTHWVCLVVYVQQKRLRFMDSMGTAGTYYTTAMLRYLKLHLELESIVDWTVDEQDGTLPRQEDGYSCGVFIIRYLDRIASDLPVQFDHSVKDMLEYRKNIAHSIVRGQLLPNLPA